MRCLQQSRLNHAPFLGGLESLFLLHFGMPFVVASRGRFPLVPLVLDSAACSCLLSPTSFLFCGSLRLLLGFSLAVKQCVITWKVTSGAHVLEIPPSAFAIRLLQRDCLSLSVCLHGQSERVKRVLCTCFGIRSHWRMSTVAHCAGFKLVQHLGAFDSA